MNTAAQGGGASMFNLIIMFVVIYFIIMMFMSGRGQKKREQERQAKINALQKGDGVIISGGIVGTVAGFKDTTVEIKIAEGVKITVLKSSIIGFLSDGANTKGGTN